MTTPAERIKALRLTDVECYSLYCLAENAGRVHTVGGLKKDIANAQYDKLLRGLVEILEIPLDHGIDSPGPEYYLGYDHALNRMIRRLREALGDDPTPATPR